MQTFYYQLNELMTRHEMTVKGIQTRRITGLLMRSPTLSNNVYMSKIVDTIPLRVRCDPVIRTTVKEDGSDAANCRQVVQSTAKVLDHLDRLDYLDHVDHLEHLEHHIV